MKTAQELEHLIGSKAYAVHGPLEGQVGTISDVRGSAVQKLTYTITYHSGVHTDFKPSQVYIVGKLTDKRLALQLSAQAALEARRHELLDELAGIENQRQEQDRALNQEAFAASWAK